MQLIPLLGRFASASSCPPSCRPDAEIPEFRVADIEGRLEGFEGVDQTLGEAGVGVTVTSRV